MSFLVNKFQRPVNVLELGGQGGKVSAYIRSYLFPAMNTFVFLNVGGNLFGNGVMMPKDVAKKSFHNVGFRYALVGFGAANGSL